MRTHFRLASLSLATLGLWGSLANAQAALTVDPSIQSTSVGGVVTVDVSVSNVSDLYGYQFDLTFNPAILSAVSSSEGSFLPSSGNATFFVPGSIDNVGGTVSSTLDTLTSAVSGVSGSGELAVFTFDAIGTGTSTIGIQNETLLDSTLSVIADTVTSGAVTVTSGVTGAPEIDAASAATALTLLLGGIVVLRGRRVRCEIGRR
jgi:Cohesin domain